MAQQQLKKPQSTFDDEIDLFQLLHFIVRTSPYWITSGIGFGLLGLLYVLFLMPLTGTIILKNDIGLMQQTLALTQAKLPGLIKPLSELNPNDRVLNNLSNPEWLNQNIKGISGLESINLTKLDSLDKKNQAIDSITLTHKAPRAEQLNNEILRLASIFRSGQQYISLITFIMDQTKKFQQRQIEIRNTLEVNQLKIERLGLQIKNYQAIAQRYPESSSQQLVIEIKNLVGEYETNTESMNQEEHNLEQFKYLPITSQLTALETKLSDLQTKRSQFLRELEAISLGLNKLDELNSQIPAFSLDVNVKPMLALNQTKMSDSELTPEARVVFSDINKQLTLISLHSNQLNQQVPLFYQQQGKSKLIVTAGVLGGVLGFLFGAGLELVIAYRRRYH